MILDDFLLLWSSWTTPMADFLALFFALAFLATIPTIFRVFWR